MEVSINGDTPNGWFIIEKPKQQMDDLGVPGIPMTLGHPHFGLQDHQPAGICTPTSHWIRRFKSKCARDQQKGGSTYHLGVSMIYEYI